jgi:hypothetical protein
MPEIPALAGLRHEDHEFEVSKGYTVRLSQRTDMKTVTQTTRMNSITFHILPNKKACAHTLFSVSPITSSLNPYISILPTLPP